jgi:hypothetical protein
MGLRDRADAAADRVATLVSSVFVTAPDHPNRGGVTGSERRDGTGEGEDPDGRSDAGGDGDA